MVNIARTLVVALLLGAMPAAATVTSSVTGTTLAATSDGADAIAIACVGGNVQVNGANPGTGVAPCASITQVNVVGGPGANDLSLTGVNVGVFPAVTGVSVNGAGGDDTLRGSAFADTLIGDAGNDTIDGNQGNDVALMGAGDDVFNWDPGDGSDIVEGQADADTLRFNGANITENINLQANGGRLLFTRDVANIVMDCNDVERVEMNALGGADNLTVNPLQGTDVTQVVFNLAAAGGLGDAASDTVTFNGGAAADTFDASGSAIFLQASDGFTTVAVPLAGAELANDRFIVAGQGGNDRLRANVSAANTAIQLRLDGGVAGTDTAEAVGTAGPDSLVVTANGTEVLVTAPSTTLFSALNDEALVLTLNDGNDVVSATGNLAALTAITIDAGAGDDTIAGSNGADVILGGDGNDTIDGNQGNDTALMGANDDTFNWDPGDGSDIVEGQGGADILRFNGSNANENIQLLANGGRLLLTRDIAAIAMDCNDVERVELSVFGGIDTFGIGDLSGTDVTQVSANLAASIGGGDGAADTVIVGGTAAADAMTVSSLGALVLVSRPGLVATVANAELVNDQVVASGLGGDDTLTTTIAAGTLARIVLDGGANSDTARIDGEDVGEVYSIVPNGAGARLTRNLPTSAAVEANNAERFVLNAAGDVDFVTTQLLPTLPQSLDGGDPAVFPGGDTLTVTNFAGEAAVSPIVQAGFASISHQNFEFGRSEGFLTGPQVVPPTPSLARGTGAVTLNQAGNAVTVVASYSGLGSSSALVHLHCPAARGANGPVVLNLPASGATSGSFTAGPLAVTSADATALQSGLCYLDVHTVNFPNGEIRGQVDNVQFRNGFE